MIDLKTVDPATMKAGEELDALVAERRGWTDKGRGLFWDPARHRTRLVSDSEMHCTRKKLGIEDRIEDGFLWSPSTNPAHAVEAMLEATYFRIDAGSWGGVGVWLSMRQDEGSGFCSFDETNGDKGLALSLSVCRAIAAAARGEAT